MASYRIPGPQGFNDEDDLLLHRVPFGANRWPFRGGMPPCTLGMSAGLHAELIDAENNEKELKLLQEVFGVLSKGGKAYRRLEKKGKKKAKLVDDVDAYVKDRDAFFGSATEYKKYKETAVGELEADKGKLRNLIEPNLAARKGMKNWKDAQNIFYAWVRRSYEQHPDVPKGSDIAKIIKSHSSESLKKALDQVRVDYGKPFQAGGFNPRPMKLAGKYRLGTLSEHAIGNAIDIDAEKNAQITAAMWGHILKFTGKSLDHAARKSKWKADPKGLYDSMVGVNDEFVKKLNESVQKAEKAAKDAAEKAAKEAAEKAAAAKAPPGAAKPEAKPAAPADPLDTAIAASEDLKKIDRKFLVTWRNGFLSLEWALVKELQEEGFTWGATFTDPDLHHFEL